MCGVNGFVSFGRYKAAYDHVFAEGLYMSALRGMDSTGVAIITPTQYYVHKKAMSAADFIETSGFKKATSMMRANCVVMGHARSATRGTVSNENAHPFEAGHIILTHNGSILNHHSLDSGVTSDVDSCHIANAIAKHGAAAILPKINGAAILHWFDNKENTFNLARTKERNCYWCFDEDGTMWYASEWEMLVAALNRNGVKIKRDENATGISYPEANHWFKWDITGKKPVEVVEFEGYKYPNYGGSQRPFGETTMTKDGQSSSVKDGGTSGTGNSKAPKWGKSKSPGAIFRLSSARSIKKANEKLERLGVKIDDEVDVRASVFVPYKVSNRFTGTGVLVGTVWGKNVKVKMFDIHNDEYQFACEMNRAKVPYKVRVINVGKEEGGEMYIVAEECPNIVPEGIMEPKGDIPGPNEEPISLARYKELMAQGCCGCSAKVAPELANTLVWFPPTAPGEHWAPVCESCQIDWGMKEENKQNA